MSGDPGPRPRRWETSQPGTTRPRGLGPDHRVPGTGIPDPDRAAGVVLHQPLAAGPCPRSRGPPGNPGSR